MCISLQSAIKIIWQSENSWLLYFFHHGFIWWVQLKVHFMKNKFIVGQFIRKMVMLQRLCSTPKEEKWPAAQSIIISNTATWLAVFSEPIVFTDRSDVLRYLGQRLFSNLTFLNRSEPTLTWPYHDFASKIWAGRPEDITGTIDLFGCFKWEYK